MKHITSSALRSAVSACCALLLTAFASSAHAALVFDLNNDSCTGGCGPAGTSFGTVTLSVVDDDTVHVDVALNSSFFIDTGAGYALTWNGPANEAVDNISAGFQYLGFGSYDTGGNFGVFNYAIECLVGGAGACSKPGGGGGITDVLGFDVTHVPTLDLADFVATNPQGFYFTVDLIGPSGLTGVIGASNFERVTPQCIPGEAGCGSSVPEPATLLLVGASLLGLYTSRRAHVNAQTGARRWGDNAPHAPHR